MSWLLDTLAWTGALIAAVLLLRRGVARHFGPTAAYALWVVPVLRLLMPPIVLPAWLAWAPAREATEVELLFVHGTDAAPVQTAADAPTIDWMAVAQSVWLAGAAVFIIVRLASYFRLRRSLLAAARPVGFAGAIRLVETPATASPLAFGLIDKVIALPPGFMAWEDRRARDLALAHELAHHRAHDLALNFLALPLFALHWFNPLSRYGWNAMRRDQEAACDARVVAQCDRAARAAYAGLIASTVAGPRGALAAPMACPVLGDASIVHRLRNLAMTTHSPRRRRVGGLLIAAGALLVPLTASISYAQDETPAPPPPPPAPLAPRAPDAPLPPIEPGAPLRPDAPAAPEPGLGPNVTEGTGPDGTRRIVIIERDGPTDGQPSRLSREVRVVHVGKDGKFDGEALDKEMKALKERLGSLDRDLDRRIVMPDIDVERVTRDAHRATRLALATAPRAPMVTMNCAGQDDVSETTTADGRKVIRICRQRIEGHALGGLRAARAQIARQQEMSEATRADVLDKLDREIARLEADRSAAGH